MPEHHRIAVFRIVHGEHTPDGDTLNWEVCLDTSLLSRRNARLQRTCFWSVEHVPAHISSFGAPAALLHHTHGH